MPARYEIDTARRLVLSSAFGTFTDDDMRAHLRELVADPAFDPEFRQLLDFREVTRLEITSAAVRELAARNPWKQPTRRAFVCGSDEVYGMSRMYQMLVDGGSADLAVFRDMVAASSWLGIELEA